MKLPENFDIEQRAAKARQNFLDGYNCCQAVLLAFQDIWNTDENTIAAIASGFGGIQKRKRKHHLQGTARSGQKGCGTDNGRRNKYFRQLRDRTSASVGTYSGILQEAAMP